MEIKINTRKFIDCTLFIYILYLATEKKVINFQCLKILTVGRVRCIFVNRKGCCCICYFLSQWISFLFRIYYEINPNDFGLFIHSRIFHNSLCSHLYPRQSLVGSVSIIFNNKNIQLYIFSKIMSSIIFRNSRYNPNF